MAKTKRRDNKVRNRRTKSRRGGGPFTIRGKNYGPNDAVPFKDRFHLPFNRTSANAGFVFDKNYHRPSRFSIIPPLSSLFSSGVRKPKKNMYEQFVYNRQKEIEKIRQIPQSERTYADYKRITQLQDEIAEYKMKNENMLREGATRSKYPLAQRLNEARYDATRALLGPEGRYSSDSSDSD